VVGLTLLYRVGKHERSNAHRQVTSVGCPITSIYFLDSDLNLIEVPNYQHENFELKDESDRRANPGARVLRVVCDPRTMPLRIVTVHFDRSMKGKL
jgi:hypothetical protein